MAVKFKAGDYPIVTAKFLTFERGNTFGQNDPVGAIRSNVREPEDEFKGLYEISKERHYQLIEPPFNMIRLEKLVQENNALSPCIEALVTNIDGTGFEIEPKNSVETEDDAEEEVEDKQADNINEFFAEPWPGESFISIRKRLRREVETTGNAYLEVLRNLLGQVIFIRCIDSTSMRMLKLGEASPVPKVVLRGGREFKVTVMIRERRFAQKINERLIFFREFGTSREIDKISGLWAKKGETISPQLRGTEVIHFTALKDDATPYGIPRWISQLPSVLGSREAEEHNLGFFDSGGIPPILILVSGGRLAENAEQALSQKFASKTGKHEAVVMHAEGTTGDINAKEAVKIQVERFGSEKQNDSMFEDYDKRSFERVRTSFRLPPIFVGKAEDFSFATAFASYTVAEAQVFAPERSEFDEIINLKLMPEIGGDEHEFRSMPLMVKDASNQLKAIEMAAKNNLLSGEELTDTLNEITNMNMKFSADEFEGAKQVKAMEMELQAQLAQDAKNAAQGVEAPEEEEDKPKDQLTNGKDKGVPPGAKQTQQAAAPTRKSEEGLLTLAEELYGVLNGGAGVGNPTMFKRVMQEVTALHPDDRNVLNTFLAMKTFTDPLADPEGLGELAGCALAVMAENQPPEKLN